MSQLCDASEGIIARIESLKKWQLEQQERLLAQQSQQSAFLSNEHKRMYEALGLESLVDQVDEPSNSICIESTKSKYLQYDDDESEEYIQAKFDDCDQFSRDAENLDEKQIKLSTKEFTELLEEKLNAESANHTAINNNGTAKRTFLRRGAGLSRFRMSINDLAYKKPKHKLVLNKVRSVVNSGAKKTSNVSREKAVCTNELSNGVIPRKNEVQSRIKQRKEEKFFESKRQNTLKQPLDVGKRDSILNMSEQIATRPVITAEYKDKTQNGIFPQVDVTCNTPNTKAGWREIGTVPSLGVPEHLTLVSSQAIRDKSPRSSQDFPAYQALLAELMEVRRRDPSVFDTPLINNSAESSQQMFERDILDELKIFELLEQKASNSSFCSTSSLVMRLMEHSVNSTPKRVVTITSPKMNDHLRTSEEQRTDHSDNSLKLAPRRTLSFASGHQEETVCEDAKPLETTDNSDSESTVSDTASSSVNSDDISDGVDAQILHPLADKSSQRCKDKRIDYPQMLDASTNTIYPSVDPELLKIRLEELENEIATFRIENARIAKLKSELETEQRNLDKRKRVLEKEFCEQKTQLHAQLDEEKAKLAKDKLVYDRYARELKEGKSARKKDREEVSALRSQISTVEEEFKMKESRWAATQARLRNQLRQLEKDNVALKSENTELRTKNGKLEASHKQLVTRRPTDTKVLHEINKNLTKLAQEAQIKTTPSTDEKEDGDVGKRKTRNKNRSNPTKRVSLLSEPECEKENDRNFLKNIEDTTSTTDHSFELVERQYERMFGKSDENQNNEEIVLPVAEASSCSNTSGQREETVLEDGSVQTSYSNGNVRTVSADGQFIVMRYHNGDIKETCHNTGTIRYLYADACTWHTTFPDGMELLEFSNGQTEKRFANGASEIHFPNGCRRSTSPGGTEEVTFPDGTQLLTRADETEKILTLPNGQREVHTPEHKRREYPDGTVKLIYNDGIQETRYANGRIRLKDQHGNLILDSAGE